MSEQIKREPGASRKAERRQRIDITLPLQVIEYLDKQKLSRSRFIEQLIQAHITFPKDSTCSIEQINEARGRLRQKAGLLYEQLPDLYWCES